jgi:SAM-dependent methyltransferase
MKRWATHRRLRSKGASSVRFELPPPGTLQPNNENDPLRFYYQPWVGWLYRRRLQMGLDLLPPNGERVLEVGVGSGVLVETLTRRYPVYTGVDLELAPGLEQLVAEGCSATFQVADLLREHDLPAEAFDAIVCFSVLEHIRDLDRAARQLGRALVPGGILVTGYPMVSPLMSRAFELIGFEGIDAYHVSPPVRIAEALCGVLRPVDRTAFPPFAPVRAALYQCTSWTTSSTPRPQTA